MTHISMNGLCSERGLNPKATAKLALASSAAILTLMVAMPAQAQDVTEDEVIATGIRSSLRQSLDVKRNSDAVVDAISAEDVGKFPDNNVAEALQRITGVSIDRSGGEGQFITVRGLGPEFNAVLLNGRTIATDNDGREFSFDVLSSDIIQRAEVFKSSTPELQSGGIGALVNIVTNRPFDARENYIGASLAGTYDTLRDEISPDGSVVGSWTSDNGRIGFSGGVAYSDRKVQIDRVLTNGFSLRSGAPFIDTGGAGPNAAVGLTDVTVAGVGENADGDDVFVLPEGARVQQQAIVSRDVQDRERLTLNGAFQAQLTDSATLTVDGLYSEFDIQSFDSQFSGFFSPPFIDPVVDENGTVTSFFRPGVDFLANNPGLNTGASQNDNVLTSNNRQAETYLVGANLDIDLSDRVNWEIDVSTSKAQRDQTNPFVVLGALAPESPLIALPSDAEITTLTNIVGAQNASIQRLHFVNVDRRDVEDEIWEARTKFDFENGSGDTVISIGGSYSDRQKIGRQFDNFSAADGFGIFCAYCGYTVDFDDNILQNLNLDGFLSGVDGADRIPLNFLTASFEDAFAALNDTANITAANRGGRGAISDADLIARRDASNSIFGFYEPSENLAAGFNVKEKIASVFVNFAKEGVIGDMPFAANIGIRLAHTETTSTGQDANVREFRESNNDTQLVVLFDAPTQVSVDNSYFNALPSANLKLEVAEDKIVRLAASKTVTRPTLTSLGVSNVFGGRSNAPTSGGGNPELEAFESTNFDASFEWYLDRLSYFSLAGFHKSFDQFQEQSTILIPRTLIIPAGNIGNNTGADLPTTVPFADTRIRNGEEGSITGLEVAFQKAFDNGFGGAVNYTYVTSSIDRAAGSGLDGLDYNGLSPHSFNVSGFYEQGPFQARVSYNYRDEFLVQAQSDQGEPRSREAFGQLDFSAAYAVNDQFSVFAEGINVLDEDTRDFSRFQNRFLTYSDTGSRYTIGVRGRF